MHIPYVIFFTLVILFLIFALLWLRYKKRWTLIAGIMILVFLILLLYFFRDPDRRIPETPNCIVSPADGKIVEIKRGISLFESNCPYTKIAIYLSLFDVHIQRVPVSGRVVFSKHVPGCFHPAFSPEASVNNEYAMIGIANQSDTLYVKQIAGMLARRIVCQLKVNDRVETGEKYGMIRLGSRVEIFIPETIDLILKTGDRVRGGESVIGFTRYEN